MSRELVTLIEEQKALLIAVATSGPRVQDKLAEYANRRARIRELLAAAGMPDPIPFRTLWDWHARWTDGTLRTFSERREHIASMIQPALDALGGEQPHAGPSDHNGALDVFISHSGRDRDLAGMLANLLRSALHLLPERIRCTSVDGYRLSVGADAAHELREEAREATAFIALLTPQSLASQFVLFEIGARWGAGLHFAPVLAGGLSPGDLKAPLSAFNALVLTSRPQIHQLLHDIAILVRASVVSVAAYESELSTLTERAASTK
jgi:hypothetical protein